MQKNNLKCVKNVETFTIWANRRHDRYKELDVLTQPACFSVHMPFGLPIIMKLVPRHLALNVAPSRVDTTEGAVKGPFLYVPLVLCTKFVIKDVFTD
jgi:hypothetical protein